MTPGTPGTPAPVVPVAPGDLARFVPEPPPGWRLAAPPSAALLDDDGVPFTSVTAGYLPLEDPDGTGPRGAEITLQDTAGRLAGLREVFDPGSAAEGDGTDRTILAGHPARVLDGGIVNGACILVADRYAVYLAVTGGSRADLDAFLEALDLDGLAAFRQP